MPCTCFVYFPFHSTSISNCQVNFISSTTDVTRTYLTIYQVAFSNGTVLSELPTTFNFVLKYVSVRHKNITDSVL